MNRSHAFYRCLHHRRLKPIAFHNEKRRWRSASGGSLSSLSVSSQRSFLQYPLIVAPVAILATTAMIDSTSNTTNHHQQENNEDRRSHNDGNFLHRLLRQRQQQQQRPAEKGRRIKTYYTAGSSIVTHCDNTSGGGGLFHFLQRKESSDRIRNLTDARSLENVYDVDWKSPLGEGGFGAVYSAINKQTKEKVAIKKISKEHTSNDGFHREMQAFLQIRNNGGHPNICGLHDYFDNESGDYFLALDLVSGGEMFEHLINSGPYSEADAARFVQEVARALDFLHGIGIVHGDLKPENLMLSTEHVSDAVVKVIDFGTAQVLDEDGHPIVALGGGRTEAYCPPEVLKQLRGIAKRRFGPGRHHRGGGPPALEHVDPSMDMWALGIILYVMLVGAHPYDMFGKCTDDEIAYKIMYDVPIDLGLGSDYANHLSEASTELIRKLLAYKVEDRITANELLKEPWVLGHTASEEKIEESNKRLAKFRRFKSKVGLKVFEDMFNLSAGDEYDQSDYATTGGSKMSLIERSFRNLDTEQKGFITVKDMGRGTGNDTGAGVATDNNSEGEESDNLSLSAFSTLLSDSMKNEYYKKGDVIYKEGDKGEDMIFINSGVVEVTNAAGFRTTLNQGDFVGEGSLLSSKPRSGTVKCKTPVHAIKITKEYFDKYLSTSESGLSLKMLEKDKDRENSRIIFSAFSDLLKENMRNEKFEEGAIVYREGEKGDDMFFINNGVVEVSNKDGFRATLKQGDFVGEGALLSNKPRSGTVKCLTEVEGMKISKEYFDKYLASSDNAELRLKMREKAREREIGRTNFVLRNKHSISKNSNTISFKGGEYVFKEGDRKKNLYIVDDGIVELEMGGHPVSKLKSGDIFGEYSIVFNRRRNASAKCITRQCKVLELPGKEVATLLEHSPSLNEQIKVASFRRDFQKAVVLKTRKEFPKTPKALKTAFRACVDTLKNNDENEITLPIMTSLLRNMNPQISDGDIKAIFDSIDMNGKGSIDFDTFKLVFEM